MTSLEGQDNAPSKKNQQMFALSHGVHFFLSGGEGGSNTSSSDF
jgi:hypothetical protein